MAKKPTTWQKMEAVFILTLVLWVIMGIAEGVLHFIQETWKLSLPLSILAIWWYIHRDGNR